MSQLTKSAISLMTLFLLSCEVDEPEMKKEIDMLAIMSSLEIYPLPVKDTLFINFAEYNSRFGQPSYKLYKNYPELTMQDQLVLDDSAKSYVNFSTLENGIYRIDFWISNNFTSRRMVKESN